MQPTLVIIGPSGSGKSTLATELARRGLVTVVPTWTTRPRRADERDGSPNHRFVDDATFDAVEAAGGFLGTAHLFGHRYGLPPVRGGGRMPAVVARAGVLGLLRRHVHDPLVVQVEVPPAHLRRVLAERAETPARLRVAYEELLVGRCVAGHVLVNDGSVDQLVDAALTVLRRHQAVAA
jgi:ribose 1,5-bisphosphokinase PhnN